LRGSIPNKLDDLSSLIAIRQDLVKTCLPNSRFPDQYQTIGSLGSEVTIYVLFLYKNHIENNRYRELERHSI